MMLFWVALGGAIGASARYLLSGKIGEMLGIDFPYGTMIINITGSLLMGIVIGSLAKLSSAPQELRAFLAVGVLGGYTTFSSFSLEVLLLLEKGAWQPALSYIGASVVFSIAAVWVGMMVMRMV